MLADRRGEACREVSSECDPVPFDDEIEIAHGSGEKQIANDAARQIERDAAFARQLRGRRDRGAQPAR